MKKIIISLLVLAGTLSMTSCKDFLDNSSPSTLNPDDVFGSVQSTNEAIIGLYTRFSFDRGYAQTLGISIYNGSDIELQKFTTGQPASGDARAMGNYLDTPTTGYLNDIWNLLYIVIEYANLAIEGIESSPLYNGGTDSEKAKMRHYHAEAKVIRAMCYMELCRIYGNVPFKMASTSAGNMYLGKTDVMEIYAALVEDLGEVVGNLEWSPAGGTERVGQGFGRGLRARLALYRAGKYFTPELTWADGDNKDYYHGIVVSECEKIIENNTHSLNRSFANVFYNQCQKIYDVETIFEIGMAVGKTSEIGHLTGVPFSQSTRSPYGFTGGGNSVQTVTPISYYYSFKTGDNRRETTIAWYNFEDVDNEYKKKPKSNPLDFSIAKWSAKYMLPEYWTRKASAGSNKVTTGINFVVMRYSDILLMHAESANALGQTGPAKESLLEVRARAYYPASYSMGQLETHLGTYSSFQEAIEDERMWEFGGEGIRKYDLIRWGKITDKIIEMKRNIWSIVSDRIDPYTGNTIPNYLYVNWDTTDKEEFSTIEFRDEKYETVPTGFKEYDWAKNADDPTSDPVKTGLTDYLYQVMGGIVKGYNVVNNGVPYKPISSAAISDSRGTLRNDYGLGNKDVSVN